MEGFRIAFNLFQICFDIFIINIDKRRKESIIV